MIKVKHKGGEFVLDTSELVSLDIQDTRVIYTAPSKYKFVLCTITKSGIEYILYKGNDEQYVRKSFDVIQGLMAKGKMITAADLSHSEPTKIFCMDYAVGVVYD